MDALSGMWERIPAFALVFARLAGLVLTFPLLGARAVPISVRVLLALGISWAVLPLVPKAFVLPIEEPWRWCLGVAKEAVIGLGTGWMAQALLASVPLASQVLGYQMGLGIANVMDPVGQHQMGVVAQFLQILALWLFLAVDGHHWAIGILLGNWSTSAELWFSSGPEVILHMGTQIFSGALALAAPALLVLLFVQVGLGILARMMPQMNIFLVTAPFQVGVGLLAMGLTLTALSSWLSKGMVWLVGTYTGHGL